MPHLEGLRIEHFRGFLEPQEFSFATPNEVPGSGLTILVGPNNVGKSTVVEALRTVVTPPQFIDRRERHVDKAVRISIKDSTHNKKEITNPGLGATITTQGNAFPTQSQLRYVPSRRPWASRASPQRIDLAGYWTNRSIQSRTEDTLLIGRISAFPPEEKVAFEKILSELAPQIRSWNIEYSDGHAYLEYTTLNGSQHNADLFGDGIASLFRIALALYDPIFDVFVVIDEPELSLHPQAQKRLADFISRSAAHRQILVCTHSPYFVNWGDLATGTLVYRLRQTRDGIKAARLSSEAIEGLRRLFEDWEKPQLLDPVAREVFFADEVVFFEGQEDIGLIRRFTEQEGITPIQTFGYGVGGAGNIKIFLKMAADLNIPAFAVFDGSSKREYDDAKNLFPNIRMEQLPTEDIRDKPATPNRKARDGLFNNNGSIKKHHRQFLIDLIAEIRSHLDECAAP